MSVTLLDSNPRLRGKKIEFGTDSLHLPRRTTTIELPNVKKRRGAKNNTFFLKERSSPSKVVRNKTEGHIRPSWRNSCTTSCVLGTFPSAPPPTRKFSREAAKARAALHAKVEAHLNLQALLCSASEDGRFRPCFGSGQLAQEQSRLLRPSTPNLAS